MQCSKKGEKKNGKCIRKREKIFQVIIHIFLILLALCAVLPIWILVAGSITGEQELILSGYSFIPKTLSLDAYKYLFYKGADILRAYGITILSRYSERQWVFWWHRFLRIRCPEKTLKQETFSLFWSFYDAV